MGKALFFLLLLPLWVSAQTLYRYVDKDGRTVVTDQLPKGVPFVRVEYDRSGNVIEPPRRTSTQRAETASGGGDLSSQRSRLRDELRAAVDAARERLKAAQAELDEGRDPREDEWRPTVTQPDNGGRPNAKGVITGRGGRVVCNKDTYGRVVCPAVPVPNEGYLKRLDALQQAVKDAEQALHNAEQRYRREAPD